MITEKLRDNFHVVLGNGGNLAVVTGGDGTLMVDAGLAPQADELLALVAGLAPAPVKTLFTTHWHMDHIGANPQLGRAGARILGHANCLRRLSETIVTEIFNRTVPPLDPAGRPAVTFTDGGRLDTALGPMEYVHTPAAHTDGDAFVHFPEANILQAGDLFFNRLYPIVDYVTGGWLPGLVAAHDAMLARCDAKTRVIPGHGPVAGRAELQASRDLLATVLQRLEKARAAGHAPAEAAAAAPTREFDPVWGKGMITADQFVKLAYTSLLRHPA